MGWRDWFSWWSDPAGPDPGVEALREAFAELADQVDPAGVPLYPMGDLDAALNTLSARLPEPEERAFWIQSARHLCEHKGDPTWILGPLLDVVGHGRGRRPWGDYRDELREVTTALARIAANHARRRRAAIFDEPRFHWWFEEPIPGALMPTQLMLHLYLPMLARLGTGPQRLSPERMRYAWSVTTSIATAVDFGCDEMNHLVHAGLHDIIDMMPDFRVGSGEILARFAQSIREAYDGCYREHPDRYALSETFSALSRLYRRRGGKPALAKLRDLERGDNGQTEEVVLASMLFDCVALGRTRHDLPVMAVQLVALLAEAEEGAIYRALTLLRGALRAPETRRAARAAWPSLIALLRAEVPEMTPLRRLERTLARLIHPSARLLWASVTDAPDVNAERVQRVALAQETILLGDTLDRLDPYAVADALLGLAEADHDPTGETPCTPERDQDKVEAFLALHTAPGMAEARAQGGPEAAWRFPLRTPSQDGRRVRPTGPAAKRDLEQVMAHLLGARLFAMRVTDEAPWRSRRGRRPAPPEGNWRLPRRSNGYVLALRDRLVEALGAAQNAYRSAGQKEHAATMARGVNEVRAALSKAPLRLAAWSAALAAAIRAAGSVPEPVAVWPALARSLLEMAAVVDLTAGPALRRLESVDALDLPVLDRLQTILTQVARMIGRLGRHTEAAEHLRALNPVALQTVRAEVLRALGIAPVLREARHLRSQGMPLDGTDGEIEVRPCHPLLIASARLLNLRPVDLEVDAEPYRPTLDPAPPTPAAARAGPLGAIESMAAGVGEGPREAMDTLERVEATRPAASLEKAEAAVRREVDTIILRLRQEEDEVGQGKVPDEGCDEVAEVEATPVPAAEMRAGAASLSPDKAPNRDTEGDARGGASGNASGGPGGVDEGSGVSEKRYWALFLGGTSRFVGLATSVVGGAAARGEGSGGAGAGRVGRVTWLGLKPCWPKGIWDAVAQGIRADLEAR